MNTETGLFPENTNEKHSQEPDGQVFPGDNNAEGGHCKPSLQDILSALPSAADMKLLIDMQKTRMTQLEELNKKLYADNHRYADILSGASENELLLDIIQLYLEIGLMTKAIENKEDPLAWRSLYFLIPRRIADLLYERDVEEYTPEPGLLDPKLMDVVGTVHTDDPGKARHVAEVKMPGFIKHIHKENGDYQVKALRKAKVTLYTS